MVHRKSIIRSTPARLAALPLLAMLLWCNAASSDWDGLAELLDERCTGMVRYSGSDLRCGGLFFDVKLSRASLQDYNLGTSQVTRVALSPAGVSDSAGSGTNQNRDGTCVVGYQDRGNGTPYHAFRWTQATGPVDLGHARSA